jgi:flagella basal body P-ring formation protein FlgA
VLLTASGTAVTALPVPQADPADAAGVRAAIVEAVRARVGATADVRVEDLLAKVPRGEGRLVATPEPGARLERPIRFSLSRTRADAPDGMTWAAGSATATVFVTADCVRAARPLPAGTTLAAGDLVTGRSEAGPIVLQRLPAAADVVGARVIRRLEPGDAVLATMVAVRQAVRSGDRVTIRTIGHGVEVEAQGIATGSGGAGDTIRVVNSASRRPLSVRVVGAGEVEVIR